MSSERSYVPPLSAQRPLWGSVLLQIRSRIVKWQLSRRGFPRHSVIYVVPSGVSMANKGNAVWPWYCVQVGHRGRGDSCFPGNSSTPREATTSNTWKVTLWSLRKTLTSPGTVPEATHSQSTSFPTASVCDQGTQDQPAGTASNHST